ncbi:MAG: hypothetical protein M3R15_00410, partial [Acidobacteriota bacterium]|nr:hypothetical protein [Acidobacteriota bacterium]
IPILVEHFLKKSTTKHGIDLPKISREVFNSFFNYPWYGNVRELENVVERMVVLSDGGNLTISDVPDNIRNPSKIADGLWFSLPAEPINLENLECEILREALSRHAGNQSQTAKYLGMTRSALIYRMQKYGLE